jgi:hypothetical protein
MSTITIGRYFRRNYTLMLAAVSGRLLIFFTFCLLVIQYSSLFAHLIFSLSLVHRRNLPKIASVPILHSLAVEIHWKIHSLAVENHWKMHYHKIFAHSLVIGKMEKKAPQIESYEYFRKENLSVVMPPQPSRHRSRCPVVVAQSLCRTSPILVAASPYPSEGAPSRHNASESRSSAAAARSPSDGDSQGRRWLPASWPKHLSVVSQTSPLMTYVVTYHAKKMRLPAKRSRFGVENLQSPFC